MCQNKKKEEKTEIARNKKSFPSDSILAATTSSLWSWPACPHSDRLIIKEGLTPISESRQGSLIIHETIINYYAQSVIGLTISHLVIMILNTCMNMNLT